MELGYKTQKERVRDYMLRHGSITTRECFERLGITRLAAALFLLKEDGYVIGKTGVSKRGPGGKSRYYEVFYIIKEPRK